MFNRTAFVINATLDAIGVSGVVCGGSARDTLLGKEPKDYDVVVFDKSNGIDAFDLFEDTRQALVAGGITITEEFSNNYAHSSRFAWCIKTKIIGVSVDIIGLNVPSRTPQEIVQSFDFDINSCFFDADGNAVSFFGDDTLADGHVVRVLDKAELSPARTATLSNKLPQFDWTEAVKATYDKDNT